jgi:hypothetical protein
MRFVIQRVFADFIGVGKTLLQLGGLWSYLNCTARVSLWRMPASICWWDMVYGH